MHPRTSELKKKLEGLSTLGERVEAMRDFYKGEHALLFSCGPSFQPDKLAEIESLLSQHLVVAVKQAFQPLQPWADFHLINWINQQQYRYDQKTILVGERLSSSFKDRLCGKRPLLEFEFDPYAAKAAHDSSQWLIVKRNFEDYLFSRKLYRPMGPGIMIELAFYLLYHLGVSSVTCVGWDVSKQDSNASMPHFYDTEEQNIEASRGFKKLIRPVIQAARSPFVKQLRREYLFRTGRRIRRNRVLPMENEAVWEGSYDLYQFFKDRGMQFNLASNVSCLDERIPRVSIKALEKG